MQVVFLPQKYICRGNLKVKTLCLLIILRFKFCDSNWVYGIILNFSNNLTKISYIVLCTLNYQVWQEYIGSQLVYNYAKTLNSFIRVKLVYFSKICESNFANFANRANLCEFNFSNWFGIIEWISEFIKNINLSNSPILWILQIHIYKFK